MIQHGAFCPATAPRAALSLVEIGLGCRGDSAPSGVPVISSAIADFQSS